MPSRRFRRFLGRASLAVATVLLVLAAPGARAVDPVVKACVASCNEARAACSLEVASDFEGSELACAKAGDERACLGQAKRLQKAGKKACKGSRKACKRCCKEDPKSCVLPPELPEATGSFELPDRAALPAALEEAGFPPGPDGRGFTVLALPDGVLFIDPSARSPVSAAGECADAMLACFAPPERNVAGCFAATATCRGKPWKGNAPVCCPTDCGERYQALRRDGVDEGAALAAAIWEEPSCIPGLEGHVEPAP